MDDEPTQRDVEERFPEWKVWQGVDRLYHGLRTRGAALTVRGEDWLDLSHEIVRAESFLAESRPAGWPVV